MVGSRLGKRFSACSTMLANDPFRIIKLYTMEKTNTFIAHTHELDKVTLEDVMNALGVKCSLNLEGRSRHFLLGAPIIHDNLACAESRRDACGVY